MDLIKYAIHPFTSSDGRHFTENPIAIVTVEKTDSEYDDMQKAKVIGIKRAGLRTYDPSICHAFRITTQDIMKRIEELDDEKFVLIRGLGDVVDKE